MSDDERVRALLREIQRGDETGSLADNAVLAKALGWSAVEVAAELAAAKDRSLIWGVRGGHKPAPWYSELEVTVQGKRFLSAG